MIEKRCRIVELVRVVEFGASYSSRQHNQAVVNIYRDLAKPKTFFPVVFRRALCRVRPSFVNTFAQEELDLVDPTFKASRFTRASEREVLDGVMKAVRGSIKPRNGRAGERPRWIELVRTVELGPYDCPGEAPWYFIVKIYKDLKKRSTFFPIVFRREFYRMKSRLAKKLSDEQVDIVVHDFDNARFVCASERAALTRIVRHLRGKFEPGVRERGRRA